MRIFLRKWRDPKTGEVRSLKTWWLLAYVGGTRIHVSTGTRDKRAAELVGADIVRRAELKRAGITDPFEEHRDRDLDEHVKAFLATIRARGVVQKYLTEREKHLRAFLAHRNAKSLKDMDLPAASRWLTETKNQGLSARSVNARRASLVQFGKWLVQTRRAAFDPFEGLHALNEEEDRRRVRRALTPEEAARLLEAARTRPLLAATKDRIYAGVTEEERARLTRLGETRALVYLLALGTGLRKGELRRLRWCDLNFEGAWLTVPARSAKSRRAQGVPLGERLAGALTAFRPTDTSPTDPVIPSRFFPVHGTVRADFEAAGIVSRDAEGRAADFHALRTTFITWLAMTGAHPRSAQALARHGSIDLTMNTYTDLRLVDLKGTVERLPLPATTATVTAAEASQDRTA